MSAARDHLLPEELVEAAVQHAVSVHSHEDTPELREQEERLRAEVQARQR